MSMTRERIATITDSVTALGMKLAGMGEVAALDEGEPAGELILKYATGESSQDKVFLTRHMSATTLQPGLILTRLRNR